MSFGWGKRKKIDIVVKKTSGRELGVRVVSVERERKTTESKFENLT
jgi:hypothetical protein